MTDLNHVSENSYHTDARYAQLQEFVQSSFKNQSIRIESLPGDASFRRYHRVYLGAPKDLFIPQQVVYDPSYIVMDAPPQVESIESFLRIDLLMAMRVNVPTILAKDISNGFLLLQDFGSIEFAHRVAEAKAKQDFDTVDTLYHWAIDELVKLQTIQLDLAKFSFGLVDYDAALLQREMALFYDWFLPDIGFQPETEDDEVWQQFTSRLIDNVLTQPQVVVHRDFHSRNLMQDQYNPEALGIIDFQDAVIGSYAYDLVSLIRDAYVDWDESQVNNWIEYFWQRLSDNPTSLTSLATLEEFTLDVNLIGVQRHLKILGIFIRLAKRDGKTGYLAHVPKVWRDLMTELTWLNKHGTTDIKEFVAPMYQWLSYKVSPKFEQCFLDSK